MTASALYMGILAAFVGYSASFAIVLAGVTAMGASESQAATALFFATMGMGVASILLPLATRTPAAIAWSTPGAAFLAASSTLPGGFTEAVGALIICAALIALTGSVPWLARMVTIIPKPIASALLAGVLLKLCFAPAFAMASMPLKTLPIILAWVFALKWNRIAAMPAAVVALLVVSFISVDLSTSETASTIDWRPSLQAVSPNFSLASAISVALPLYLVTMAGQNIPGFAVLELNGYQVKRPFLLKSTGAVSLGIAPFGALPVNMSAITASMMAGKDAGHEPGLRYWAAVVSGACYVILAFAAGVVTFLTTIVPPELITTVAGLALIPAFVSAISAAFGTADQLEAPALTFLIAGSGMYVFGVSGAVWGILVGCLVWAIKSNQR